MMGWEVGMQDGIYLVSLKGRGVNALLGGVFYITKEFKEYRY
jgi:hypothetical protein